MQVFFLKRDFSLNLVLLLSWSLIISSCNRDIENKKIYYIIQNENKPIEDPTDPPPPPLVFYGYFNFIIMDGSSVYFYDKHPSNMNCDDRDGIHPPFLQLYPKEIKKVKLNELNGFLEETYSGLKQKSSFDTLEYEYFRTQRNFFTSISSPKDTITNEALKVIIDFMKKNEFTGYVIRNWTEEEMYVVLAKQNKLTYNPNEIKWDVGFDPVCK